MVSRFRTRHRKPSIEGGSGIGIDRFGENVIDPTANVRELVNAEASYRDSLRDSDIRYQDAMRDAQEKYQNGIRSGSEKLREFENRLQNWMRDSESKRIDQLASLRQVYETRIAEMLAVSVKSTSDLVSTQLVQIQATFNDRVSKLEQFRWESGGKSSVSDPQISDALSRLASGLSTQSVAVAEAIARMTTTNADAIAKLGISINDVRSVETKTGAVRMGQGQLAQWIVMSVMMLAAVASAVIALIALRGH
jgi:hypothetical protein